MTTTSIDNRRETDSLIGSDKVNGTPGADDGKIGAVLRVMIDKISGKVAYAVISFAGFLGTGENYYPLQRPQLKYDTRLGGYRIGVTVDQLKGAPKYGKSQECERPSCVRLLRGATLVLSARKLARERVPRCSLCPVSSIP